MKDKFVRPIIIIEITMKTIFFILLSILLLSQMIAAQNLLNKPEHVVYDELNQCYLVTNYGNGKIISIDTEGNQEAIIEGITDCLGIHIMDTTIIVSAGHNLYLYGLTGHSFIQTVPLNVSNWVDGMTDDGNGNLYVVENAGKVHKVSLTEFTDTIVVSGGLPQYPQDLAYDPVDERLFLVCWQINSPIITIDLEDYSISELVQTSGNNDGIVRDSLGNIYVTSWLNGGRVYQWLFPYIESSQVIFQGLSGPAGPGLNASGNLLAVPNFNGNSISYIPLASTGVEVFDKSPFIGLNGDILSICGEGITQLSISDINGRSILQESYSTPKIRVDLHQYFSGKPSGVYIITLVNGVSYNSFKYVK